jgi:hypothetical protein
MVNRYKVTAMFSNKLPFDNSNTQSLQTWTDNPDLLILDMQSLVIFCPIFSDIFSRTKDIFKSPRWVIRLSHYTSDCAVTDIYCLFLQGILAAMRRHPDDKYIQISGR